MAPRIVLQLMQMMLALVQALAASRMELALENLALRQQVAALKRERPRPRLTDLDRLFWVALREGWRDWANALIIVKPETVVRWHQAAFKRHWARLSGSGKAPTLDSQMSSAICRRMPLGGCLFSFRFGPQRVPP